MTNLSDLVDEFTVKRSKRADDANSKIFLDYAWEAQAVDEDTYGELTAVQIGIAIPEAFIKRYNKLKSGKISRRLPDPKLLFDELRPLLKGRHLIPSREDQCVEYSDFDNAEEELSDYRLYDCSWTNDFDIKHILQVDGDLELDEEYENSFTGPPDEEEE